MRPGLTLVRAIQCSSVESGDGSAGTGGGDVIRIARGDITAQEVDAIVNAASEGLCDSFKRCRVGDDIRIGYRKPFWIDTFAIDSVAGCQEELQ
jgi:hypothetical protein